MFEENRRGWSWPLRPRAPLIVTAHSRRLQGLGGWDLGGHVARQESETWTRPLDWDGIRRGLVEGWEASRAVKASSRRRIHARGMADFRLFLVVIKL